MNKSLLVTIATIVALSACNASARTKAPCTFDHETVGVIPCGAAQPNKPVAPGRPPENLPITPTARWPSIVACAC